MKTQEKKKRTTDEIIAYLLQSKRELQEEIRNDVNTEEFKVALQKLRKLNADR
ncbi:hypothetical protein OGH69_15680 [Flavobacterium sp. MFBS3-15]|uniref:hypothetical protein n=1 Tax=Flavobacterium sp. MFBS3-15 TaxID=2989816 RepID=UPI00223583FB|nr:hypothetical protein [Flavobacterium sp. MFBS3-15]MCW4470414.1 hypothetical protein [Flavobacterium sp. MFBS3-15]